MVDRRVAVVGVVLVVLVAAGSMGQLSALGIGSSCDWQVLEINGETFGSMDDLAAAAEANGRSLDDLQEHGDFRVRDGVVEVRGQGCGVKEGG